MDTSLLPILLGIAVLLPLISFFVILVLGRWWKPATGGYVATAAIVSAGRAVGLEPGDLAGAPSAVRADGASRGESRAWRTNRR